MKRLCIEVSSSALAVTQVSAFEFKLPQKP
jgi:hypothetical protein